MNAHQLDANGVILNTIVVDSLDTFPDLIDAAIGGQIGDSVVNGVLVPRVAQPIIPKKVTRRQALSALLISGLTKEMIGTAINGLPISDLQKALALIEFHESLEFEYDRPLTIQMCAVMGLDRDDLFTLAGSL